MFLRLLSIESRKTLKNPALWIGLCGLLFLLGCTILIKHVWILNNPEDLLGGLEKDLLDGLAFFNWLSILVYAVTGAVIAAFDYTDRSIQLWLMRGVPRPVLLSARLAAILLFAFLIVGVTALGILGLGALSRSLFFGVVETSTLNLAALFPAVLRVFWSSLPYLALSAFLGVLSRSPFFAAGGTIVYGSVAEQFIPALSERVPWLIRFLPGGLSHALQSYNAALDLSAPPLPVEAMPVPELQVVLLIGCIFLLLSMASLVIFSRQDLGG